jgi:hypothetical protein
MKIKRSVRRSQAIVPFGPGGIFDFGDESFLALDISQWPKKNCREIRLPRLEKLLKVNSFKEPPVVKSNSDFYDPPNSKTSIPYMRFPRWLFCPRSKCNSMVNWNWKDERAGEPATCPHCKPNFKYKLAPMRFIAVCENGHLADIKWDMWAHSGKNQIKCENPVLKFLNITSKGGGLQSLSVKCVTCGAERNLKDLPTKDVLKSAGQGRCSGRHPWQSIENSENCDKVPQAVQRGASNAYFPTTMMALDISTAVVEKEDFSSVIESSEYFRSLKTIYESASGIDSSDHPAVFTLLGIISEDTQIPVKVIWDCLTKKPSEDSDDNNFSGDYPSSDMLFEEEWQAFQNDSKNGESTNFVREKVDLSIFGSQIPKTENEAWSEFSNLIGDVIIAKRIRIVKALTGFRRLDPAGKIVAPTFNPSIKWLPANETFGEGILIALNKGSIDSWERSTSAESIQSIVTKQSQSALGGSLRKASPKYVLLHTFAHLVIRQLSFECGYSASSLAERIYCGDNMSGVLIYTASSDSEGALGGLVREAEPDRIYGIIKTALFRGKWCSNDPICSEMSYQGIGGMNRAACHACALLAETSCESANALLDRAMIYGGVGVTGYFEALLKKMEAF